MKLPVDWAQKGILPDPAPCPARAANKLADPEDAFRMDAANYSADTLAHGRFQA